MRDLGDVGLVDAGFVEGCGIWRECAIYRGMRDLA